MTFFFSFICDGLSRHWKLLRPTGTAQKLEEQTLVAQGPLGEEQTLVAQGPLAHFSFVPRMIVN